MTDLIANLKYIARSYLKSHPDTPFSYSQILEIAARLFTGAPSWNHLANDTKRLYQVGGSYNLESIILRLQLVRPFFSESSREIGNDISTLVGYGHYDHWINAAGMWRDFHNEDVLAEDFLLELFRKSSDINVLQLPMSMSEDGLISFIDLKEIPIQVKLREVISKWFFQKYLSEDSELPTDRWKGFSYIAKKYGLSENDQSLYRAVCRESFNHGWSLQSMLALGLLDLPIDAGLSITQFDRTNFRSQIEAIWEHEEPGSFTG